MKIGLLFAGQGAQYPGMGKDLYDHIPVAKEVFDQAGEEIKSWSFEGTKEMLRQTQITQPCIYAVTMAAYAAFQLELNKLNQELSPQGKKIEVASIAGFSLGEYAALTAAGVIDGVDKGLSIVRLRGNLMNEAGKDAQGENRGGMVAAFGARQDILDVVELAREDGILEGVNFNSGVQTVIAGDKQALERFSRRAKEASTHLKVIPLSVGSAFHSPMMEPAVEPLFQVLLEAEMKAPKLPVYSNITGKRLQDSLDEIVSASSLSTKILATGTPGAEAAISEKLAVFMAEQVRKSVYWQEVIQNMHADGLDYMVEIGPGDTLCGLVRKIDHNIKTTNIDSTETLAAAMASLREACAGSEE